ncbi:MAG TPA: hypothetical protein VHK69_05330 [Chitinophagaceae bacterium]|nr:hypothetical protein [Chitinophagaceae bacterium]
MRQFKILARHFRTALPHSEPLQWLAALLLLFFAFAGIARVFSDGWWIH